MNQKFYIKVFKINETHHELKDKTFKEVVDIITGNHKKHIHASGEDMNIFNIQIEENESQDFKFASYCYNQPEEKHYWRLFLPDNIGQGQNFRIVKFSYVLFINFNSSIYCIIGGSGIGVIKKYINPTFGIDVYSRIAKPSEDLIIGNKSRSISNNVSLQSSTYTYNQTVADTIEYSEIPAELKIVLRNELKSGIFSLFEFDANQSILEIGSYFSFRKQISFEALLELIKILDNLINNCEAVELSFFKKIEDQSLIEQLDAKLINSITEDIKQFSYQNGDNIYRKDIDIVHPTKLESFYECDQFKVKNKNSNPETDKIIFKRQSLYTASIEHIYSRIEGNLDSFQIGKEIYKIQIIGIRNGIDLTYGTFLNHIVAELSIDSKKYFKIDKVWYHIKDVFIQKLTIDAIDRYNRYKLEENLLTRWENSIKEGDYNQLQDGFHSYNLDKIICNNIELCDVLQIKENKLYFIHVKDGFDVKLRDCYIQVVLAAKRLNNDLKDNNGVNYLIPTLSNYNAKTANNQIDINGLIENISNKTLEVVFVLAYNNKNQLHGTAIEKIQNSNSNIAKYSLINVVKEIKEVFDIKLIDISTINNYV